MSDRGNCAGLKNGPGGPFRIRINGYARCYVRPQTLLAKADVWMRGFQPNNGDGWWTKPNRKQRALEQSGGTKEGCT